MATCAAFTAAAAELAAEGRRLWCQSGVGLGFLATVRKDGGPRLHPSCPIVTDDGQFAFINPSPKCNDLRRDGRYAVRAFTSEDVDHESCVTGRGAELTDAQLRARVVAAYYARVPPGHALFGLDVEHCLHAKYQHRGDWPPNYTTWAGSSQR
jgi:hypothetical protein